MLRDDHHVVLLFVDGVGIGPKDPGRNPFFHAHLPVLRELLDGRFPSLRARTVSTRMASCVPLDATLGVEGLPQSGTGQTALFTGVNAAAVIGRHFGPYPSTDLRPLLGEKNIFRLLAARGRRVCFANAYPRQFFEYADQPRARLSATTCTCRMNGMPLRDAEMLRAGRGVSGDITRARWHQLGYPDIAPIEAATAGRHLAGLAAEHHFTLFEYWLTDHAGHAQDHHQAADALERFDALLGGLVRSADLARTLILITSDHGNVEDLSVKTHTRNPVPCFCIGWGHSDAARMLHSLMDVTPYITDQLLA